MPYTMRKKGDQWCVYNKDTGESKGCSDSRSMAVKHMRALYAVESGATLSKDLDDLSSVEELECMCDACIVGDLGDELVKAVWTAKYVNDLPDSSFAYVEPDCKTSNCRHFPIKDAEGNYDAAHVRNALARLDQSPFGAKARAKVEAGARALKIGDYAKQQEGLTETIASWFKSVVKPGQSITVLDKPILTEPVTCVKQFDGRTRVFLRVSNNFKDRHGEIITEAAHRQYEQYVKEAGDYPEFWLWHTPGTRWGRADVVSYDDGFLTMSGLVDQGKEYIAEGLAKLGQELGVSHGFKGLSLSGKGYIDWYKSFEASPLPRQEAANLWTAVMIQEKGMALADKHKKFFSDIGVPESVIADWDKQNKDLGTLLKDSGISFKDLGIEEPPPEPEPEPKPPEQVEVTLPNGSKAMVPTQSIQSKALDGAPEWAKALVAGFQELKQAVSGLEEKQKELESKQEDGVASKLEAAIQQGKGFVASKEGAQPSPDEVKNQDNWEAELSQLIMGGAK